MDGAPQQNTPETCPFKNSGRVRDAEVRCMPDELLHLPVIQRILDRDKDTPGALLPILHAVQHEIGYIPDASV
ncbi:MAG: formate dehydrogenase subunit gamma, partial [Pseudomonas alloputida]